MKFILEQSDESLATHSGLALVGALVSKTNLKSRLNQIARSKGYSPHICNSFSETRKRWQYGSR